jgi:hypothetical protein
MRTQLEQIGKLAAMLQERLDTLNAELQNFRDTFPHGGITLDRLRIVGKGAEGDIDMPLLQAMARGLDFDDQYGEIVYANGREDEKIFFLHEVAVIIDGATGEGVAA